VFATPRSWAAVSNLLDSGLKGEVLRIKIEGNIGAIETAGFYKYMKNTKLLPNIESILNGTYEQSAKKPFKASLDVYYLIVQNFIHAIGLELRKQGEKWNKYIDNSIDFISCIANFPLELQKSYIDQLCKLDETISTRELIKKHIYNDSSSKQISKLLQELGYIK